MINGVCTAIKCPAGAFLNGSTCLPPANLIGYPKCSEKMGWMRAYWNQIDKPTTDYYKSVGIDGTDLSIYKHLSNLEKVCPMV